MERDAIRMERRLASVATVRWLAVALAATVGACSGDDTGTDASVASSDRADGRASSVGPTDAEGAVPADGGPATPGDPASSGVWIDGSDVSAGGAERMADEWPLDAPQPLWIPAGTRIEVVVRKAVSTEEYAVGDAVVAFVVEPVTDSAGRALVPRGAKVIGRVTASASSGGAGEEAVLEIVFETLSTERYERPVDTERIDDRAVLDPEAEAMRKAAGARAAATMVVPGLLLVGERFAVALRGPVSVPPPPESPDSLRVPGSLGVPRPSTDADVDSVLIRRRGSLR